MYSGHGLMWGSLYSPDKPKIPKRINWQRLIALFKPYRHAQMMVLACIIVAAILGLVPGIMTAWIIDKALPQKSLQLLGLYLGIIVSSALIGALIQVVQGYLNSIVGEGIMRDLRTSLVSHLQRMPVSFFTGTKTGEIMNRVSNDVDNVDNVVTGTLTQIITNAVTIFVTVIAMFVWNWKLALLSVFVVPIMVLPLGPVGRRMYDVRRRTREQRDRIESITQETLSVSGITLIKSFARELLERSRFYDVSTHLMKLEIRLAMVGRWFLASVASMVLLGPVIVWFGGGWMAIRNELQIGVIVAFISYIQGRLYAPAATLAGIQVQVVSALAVFERIFDYLDLKTEEYEPAGAVALPAIHGGVTFDHVTFSYDGTREILSDVSFSVNAGQVAAFVGPTGAGKSTITHLVPRFYDPQQGRVLIDGHDVRGVTLDSLRRDIGIVMQETYLFHDTIANNLRYGKPDATDAELVAACTAANIHDFIASLPGGYNTVVGERGHKLSGGERQRLAIARVLLKDPRILILDEATSSLDSHSEAAIQSALEEVMRGRTSLVIAHRLSTVLSADVIFVVERGRIVEHGTHAELLARNGSYARLYHRQFRDEPAVTA
jgi:ATP-binding cassette subfamily B protein